MSKDLWATCALEVPGQEGYVQPGDKLTAEQIAALSKPATETRFDEDGAPVGVQDTDRSHLDEFLEAGTLVDYAYEPPALEHNVPGGVAAGDEATATDERA